jgi:hypothetical protein
MEAGTINERGYINSLRAQGFNNNKCLMELVANSHDAGCKTITFKITKKNILVIDNGKGMDETQFYNMFDMQRENNALVNSCGRSGIGGKVATFILSNNQECKIYTYNNVKYNRATIPWNKMYDQGKYIGMITIDDMSDEEINEFKQDLPGTGTIIKLPYRDDIKNTILEHFKEKLGENDEAPILLDTIPMVFGKKDGSCVYKHHEGDGRIMKKYNYMSGDDNKFYKGKDISIITVYKKDGIFRYVWTRDDEQYECQKKGRGFSNPQVITLSLKNWHIEGEFTLTIGQRRDKDVFDDDDPPSEIEGVSADYTTKQINPYDKKRISAEHPKQQSFQSATLIIRNEQVIGSLNSDKMKASSARGNSETYHKTFAVKAELSYNPISTQDNALDTAIGIQQNKNQFQSHDIPRQLQLIIEQARTIKSKDIWSYFGNKITAKRVSLALETNNIVHAEEEKKEEKKEEEQEKEEEEEKEEDEENETTKGIVRDILNDMIDSIVLKDGEEEKCEDTFTENDSFVETGGIYVSGRRIIDALDNGIMYTIDDITQLFNNLNKLT